MADPKSSPSPSPSADDIDRQEALRQWLARAAKPAAQAALPRAPRDKPLRMSSGQRRLYIQNHVSDVGGDLNVPIAWRLSGSLDAAALAAALDLVVERHEVLRTSYEERDGDFFQHVHPHRTLNLRIVEATAQTLVAAIEAEAYAPFDHTVSPALRAALFRLDAQDHVLVVTLPHIAMDGPSLALFVAELEAAYRPAGEGGPGPLPELAVQYADYAEIQRASVAEDAVQPALRYWERQLADAPMTLALPLDRPYPARRSYQARWHSFAFNADAVARGEALGQQEKASLFMVLLAAYALTLSRWTGSTDVVVGSPVNGRRHVNLEPLIGFFVNTLPMRIAVDHGSSFRELLRAVRRVVVDAIEHQDVPYDVLVQRFAKDRSASVNALIQAEISLNDARSLQLGLRGLKAQPHHVAARATRNDLVIAFERHDGALRGDAIYDTDLFDHATIERFAQALATTLDDVLGAPDTVLRQFGVSAAVPQGAVATEPRRAAAPEPQHRLHEIVRACAAASPERVALVAGDGHLDYAGLVREVDALAARLIAAGAGPERAVAAHMGRSAWLVVSLLATWQVGATWIPVDVAHTQAQGHADAIFDAVRPVVVLRPEPAPVGSALATQLALVPGAGHDAREPSAWHPDALAYVIFTSGTTGRPKGVGITYRNVAHLLDAIAPLAAAPGSVSPNVLAPSFDGWIWSTLLPLAHGSGVSIVDPLEAGEELLHAAGAVVTLTPTLLASVPETPPVPATLILAGEAAPAGLVARWSRHARVINAYGPTETTICATWADTARGDDPATIGHPIAHTHVYVLDERLLPVMDGMPGDLFIGGAGVGRGYLGQPGLTAARFLPDPHVPGARMYRTGDLARRRADGQLEFLGRQDAQIKVRGFRIEPAAIERVAERVPGVDAAIAFAVDDAGGNLLCLAVASRQDRADLADRVGRALSTALPDFMQPGRIIALPEIPRTAAGKADLRALAAHTRDTLAASAPAQSAPMTPTQALVARVWTDMLGVPATEVDRSFFDLGGHSLLASRVVSALRKETGLKLSIRDMLAKPTIAACAQAIERLRSPSNAD